MSQAPRNGSQACRVLVVEDDERVCDSLVLVFEAEDYEVLRAYSAEDALHLISDEKPELAIIDVSLGKMNGVDLARHILRRDSNCRVLLFSALPESKDVVEELARQGQRFNFVGKPVHPKILLEWARNGTVPQEPYLEGLI